MRSKMQVAGHGLEYYAWSALRQPRATANVKSGSSSGAS